MKSKRSRLALVCVLALALTVTVELASGSVADAKTKKKSGKTKTAVVSKTVNTAIPDRAPGATSPVGRLDVPLPITGKKFKGKVVAPDTVSVTFQTTGDSPNSGADLDVYLMSPRGRLTQLFPDFGSFGGGQSIGPLTLTPNSSVGLCNSATPPCPNNPFETLNRPFAGTAEDSYLAIYNGTQLSGNWQLIFTDVNNTKTSIVNAVSLAITAASPPAV